MTNTVHGGGNTINDPLGSRWFSVLLRARQIPYLAMVMTLVGHKEESVLLFAWQKPYLSVVMPLLGHWEVDGLV